MRDYKNEMREHKIEISRTCDFCGAKEDSSKRDERQIRKLSYLEYEAQWWPDDEDEYVNYDICEKCWEERLHPAIESFLYPTSK